MAWSAWELDITEAKRWARNGYYLVDGWAVSGLGVLLGTAYPVPCFPGQKTEIRRGRLPSGHTVRGRAGARPSPGPPQDPLVLSLYQLASNQLETAAELKWILEETQGRGFRFLCCQMYHSFTLQFLHLMLCFKILNKYVCFLPRSLQNSSWSSRRADNYSCSPQLKWKDLLTCGILSRILRRVSPY